MIKEESANTEAIILKAAREVFLQNGLDGARMQDIADRAGINKALLHYYYRSKEKLFERIFSESFSKLFENIRGIMSEEGNLEQFIRKFIKHYLQTITANPDLPKFVMHEASNRPERLKAFLLKGGIQPSLVIKRVQDAIDQELIHPILPGEIMMYMIGVCVMPVIGRPIFQGFFFNDNEELYNNYLINREKRVLQFIFNAIYINPPKA